MFVNLFTAPFSFLYRRLFACTDRLIACLLAVSRRSLHFFSLYFFSPPNPFLYRWTFCTLPLSLSVLCHSVSPVCVTFLPDCVFVRLSFCSSVFLFFCPSVLLSFCTSVLPSFSPSVRRNCNIPSIGNINRCLNPSLNYIISLFTCESSLYKKVCLCFRLSLCQSIQFIRPPIHTMAFCFFSQK